MRKLRKLVRSTKPIKKPVRLRNYRRDIKNDEVLQRIKEDGWSINKCCEKWGCSKNLIVAIVNGTRPDLDDEYTKSKIPIKDLCTSCGLRKKKRGNRFLCGLCFERGNDDEDEAYYVGFGYSSFLTVDTLLEEENEIQADFRKEVKPMVDKGQKQNDSGKAEGHNGSTKRDGEKTRP